MKTTIAAALGLALLAGGAALAQNAPPPPAPEAGPPGEHGPMDGAMEGRRGPPPYMMRGMMERAMHMRPSKAASFHFRKGDARVDIKCADDEPTKACVDAASALMDKLAAQPK